MNRLLVRIEGRSSERCIGSFRVFRERVWKNHARLFGGRRTLLKLTSILFIHPKGLPPLICPSTKFLVVTNGLTTVSTAIGSFHVSGELVKFGGE